MTLSAGMIAGLVEGAVCVVPMTTLQVKFCHDLSCDAPRYKGLRHGVQTIVSEEGWHGVYRVMCSILSAMLVRYGSENSHCSGFSCV